MNSVYSIWNNLFFFLEMVIFYNVVSTFAYVGKLDVENENVFWRCLTLFISTLKYTTLIWRCKLQRWNTQSCFNVDLTLSHVATSYQPKDNAETMFKCLLEKIMLVFRFFNYIWLLIGKICVSFLFWKKKWQDFDI